MISDSPFAPHPSPSCETRTIASRGRASKCQRKFQSRPRTRTKQRRCCTPSWRRRRGPLRREAFGQPAHPCPFSRKLPRRVDLVLENVLVKVRKWAGLDCHCFRILLWPHIRPGYRSFTYEREILTRLVVRQIVLAGTRECRGFALTQKRGISWDYEFVPGRLTAMVLATAALSISPAQARATRRSGARRSSIQSEVKSEAREVDTKGQHRCPKTGPQKIVGLKSWELVSSAREILYADDVSNRERNLLGIPADQARPPPERVFTFPISLPSRHHL